MEDTLFLCRNSSKFSSAQISINTCAKSNTRILVNLCKRWISTIILPIPTMEHKSVAEPTCKREVIPSISLLFDLSFRIANELELVSYK
jgi:hypothetical protein